MTRLEQIHASKEPVLSLTGADKELIIGTMFADPQKAQRFAKLYASVTGTLAEDKVTRHWSLNEGIPNPGGAEWRFQAEPEASDRIESERDDTASLDNARSR